MTAKDRGFMLAASVVVIAAIALGFTILGSPGRQRSVSQDQVRVDRLQQVALSINARWHGIHALPRALGEVDPAGRATDPFTGRPFGYRPLSATRYELCANFESKGDDARDRELWQHPAGRYCFRREASQPI